MSTVFELLPLKGKKTGWTLKTFENENRKENTRMTVKRVLEEATLRCIPDTVTEI
jgi:hypothetical protein